MQNITPLQAAYLMVDGHTPEQVKTYNEEELALAITNAKETHDLESMPGVLELSLFQECELESFLYGYYNITEDSLESEMGTYPDLDQTPASNEPF